MKEITDSFDEELEVLEEIPDDAIDWDEDLVDVYIVDGEEYILDDLIDDFYTFCCYMFSRKGFAKPTYIQKLIIDFIAKPSDKDKLIQAPRGAGKSYISQLKVLWDILRDNNKHILVRSASSKRSRNYTTFLLNTIKTTPLLQHLAPRSSQRKSTELFDVNGADASDSPTLLSAGISGTVTGLRASLCVLDDVEVVKNSTTPEMREKLELQISENYNLLEETNGISGDVLVLGTFQTSDSIYVPMIHSGAYEYLIIPAEYPPLTEWYRQMVHPDIYKMSEDNPELIGKAIDERLNDAFLAKRKVRVGKSEYELHYMLNPNLSDEMKYPLKLKDLIIDDIDPEENPIKYRYSSEERIKELKHRGFPSDYIVRPAWKSEDMLPFDFTTLAVDPSGRGTDETGYVVVSLMGGRIFIRDFGGVIGGYSDEALESLVSIAMKYKVNKIVGESNFGDGAYMRMLETKLHEANYLCDTEDVRATAQKETRIIETLEPLMNQHRIIVDRKAMERDFEKKNMYALTYQLTHLTKERGCLQHDDIIDVWELGVRDLVEFMARGDVISAERVEELKQQKLDDLFNNGLFPELRRDNTVKNWMSRR
jgi:hypothetical protein